MGNYRLRGAHQPTHTRDVSEIVCPPREEACRTETGPQRAVPPGACITLPSIASEALPTIKGSGYTLSL